MTTETEKIIEEKGTNQLFGELLDELTEYQKDFSLRAGQWVLIRRKINKALSLQNQKLQKIKEELKEVVLSKGRRALPDIDKIFKENE